MLKEASEDTRWGFRWEPWDWLPPFPCYLGFFSVPECSLLLSVSEQGRGVGERAVKVVEDLMKHRSGAG